MKKLILISAVFINLMWFTIPFSVAQIIYTDIEPDTTITIPSILDAPSQGFAFDLDLDGNNDFIFGTTYFSYGNGNKARQSLISRLSGSDNFVSGACLFGDIFTINESDTINSEIIWYGVMYFECVYYIYPPPPSCHFYSNNTYICLKLVKGDTAYYGWARIAADANSVTIKDYAWNTVP
ncbi:MAG: hypothetical protein HY738_21240, partial [Bacteroidia bacterium]|nr:hypothetical protein [Bacteroidia bacterium]